MYSMIHCKRMTKETLPGALRLIKAFLSEDEFYLDSGSAYGDGGADAPERALRLFLEHPENGFVWLAFAGSEAVGVCVPSFAISTSLGALVVKLDDVYVVSGMQGQGIGSLMLNALKEELRSIGVKRIDLGIHLENRAARRFYERLGFQPLNEERLACLL